MEGASYHNLISIDLYEAKSIIYIVGAYALAAGVPVRRYLDSGYLFKLGALCVVFASVLDVMSIGHVVVNRNVPLLPLQNFGEIGAETAAIFLAVGTMCFLCRLASGSARIRHVLALIPLVASVVLAGQRAVLVNLGLVQRSSWQLLVVTYRRGIVRRLHVGLGQLMLTVLAVVAVDGPARAGRCRAAARTGPASRTSSTARPTESAQDRLNLAVLRPKPYPHLIIGWGLGVELQSGSHMTLTIPYAHNIVLDLWLRLGIIGLVLFLVARWPQSSTACGCGGDIPNETAALALAIAAVLVGTRPRRCSSHSSTSTGLSPCSVSASACLRAVTSMGWGAAVAGWRTEATS